MGNKTGIAWTDSTWNPVRGCSMVSEGCRNCYAMMVAGRFDGPGMPYEGLINHTDQGPKWNGKMMEVEDNLDQPLRWGRPRLIFVNSMSDLFHEALDPNYIERVFEVMQGADRHLFQVLTKRTKRMCELVGDMTLANGRNLGKDPLENVWLGTSIEDNKAATERSHWLAQTSAHIRFWSAEPLIGDIDWTLLQKDGAKICDWVIFGGESQTGCRPLEVDWIRRGIVACREYGISPFVKQLGTIWARAQNAKSRAGEDPTEWPEDVRVREYPIDIAKRLTLPEKPVGRKAKGRSRISLDLFEGNAGSTAST